MALLWAAPAAADTAAASPELEAPRAFAGTPAGDNAVAPLAPRTVEAADALRRVRISAALRRDFAGSPVRPDQPMQDAYLPPRAPAPGALAPPSAGAASDTTPPAPPGEPVTAAESQHRLTASWTPAADPESGIQYYAYTIGSQPGQSDLHDWQSTGTATSIYPTSMRELGVAEGDSFYVSVYAVNGAGLSSPIVTGDPTTFVWEELGQSGHELSVGFADFSYDGDGNRLAAGWEAAERQPLEHFTTRMLPVIREIYGPPSRSGEVMLVKNLLYSGSNIYFPGTNEIHLAEFYPQLLTHELLHAWRDNVILSSDAWWRYHPRLSGFEEGFAQAVSYACMNRYIELYPDDPYVESTWLFGSSMDWDYDLQNCTAITTEDFWSDGGGTGIYWARYELAAAAMRKIQLEDATFYRRFNQEYFARLNADHELTTSRALMIDIIAALVPEIESRPAKEWIDRQRVFDCQVVTGHKIWVRTQPYPWNEFIIFQRVFFYETFANGSEWAIWDEPTGSWIYYGSNGSAGTGSVTRADGAAIWSGELLIEPLQNPPELDQFGWDSKGFSTDDDLEPWPTGDPADYLLGMQELGLYRFDLRFDRTEERVERVIGAELRQTTGIFGGIIGAEGGVVYVDHDGYPPEPALPVVRGAFWGERAWASVPNARTGGTDSQPGRVRIRYVPPEGPAYLARRHIDWGSQNGNQIFLLDLADMTPAPAAAIPLPAAGQDALPARLVLAPAVPNPFNPSTRIDYLLPSAGPVQLGIHDARGRHVRTLLDAPAEAGRHSVAWDGRDERGGRVASGVYFCRIRAGGALSQQKLVLAR